MKMKVYGVLLLAWWLYVGESVAVHSIQTGRVYLAHRWVPKERFLFREFCESRAKELRGQGEQAMCHYVDD